MKKLITCLFFIIILSSSLISASAEYEADAKLNVSYCFDGQNVVITAYFTDIKVKDGIISVEYDIKYDHNKFELVQIDHIVPERWEALLIEESVENFSMQRSEGVYRWGYAVVALGEGAKGDRELGFVAEFKPIGTIEGDIKISYSDLRGEVVENGKTVEFLRLSSNSAKITFDSTNSENTKLFYSNVDADLYNQNNRYYEVENITINEARPANDINYIYLYLSFAAIAIILVVTVLLIVYIFAKSKRG